MASRLIKMLVIPSTYFSITAADYNYYRGRLEFSIIPADLPLSCYLSLVDTFSRRDGNGTGCPRALRFDNFDGDGDGNGYYEYRFRESWRVSL